MATKELSAIMTELPKSTDPHAGTLLQKVGNEIKELGGNALAKASAGTDQIHNLTQTATEADLKAGNYIALDGPNGTKRFPTAGLQPVLTRPDVSDVNLMTTSGMYKVDKKFAHVPEDMTQNGMLFCAWFSSSRFVQILSQFENQKIWCRSSGPDSTGFSNWSQFYTDASLNLNDIVSSKDELSTDFDEIRTTGYYLISGGTSYQNSPISAGFLLCIYHIGNRRGFQIAMDNLDNKMFFRKSLENTWTEWREVVSDNTLSYLFSYPDELVSLYDLPGVEVLEDTNSTAGGQNQPWVAKSATANYRTFIYHVGGGRPVNVYFDDATIAEAGYVSVTTGVGVFGDWYVDGSFQKMNCVSSARVRKSENNLPSSANKLNVPPGSIILFTTASTYNPKVHIDDTPHLNPKVKIETESPVAIKYKSSDLYEIKFGSFGVTLYHTLNESTDADNWNLGLITRNDKTIVSKGTDIIGPIKLNGDADFLGGVHGSETTNTLNVYAGNKKLTLNSSLNEKCEALTIMMTSTCRRESDKSNAFARQVTIEITKDKIHLSSNFKALVGGLVVERATNGGLIAAYNRDILACSMNNYQCDSYPASAPSNGSVNNTHGVIVTQFGSIIVDNIKGGGKDGYKGSFALFSSEPIPRTKLYFDVFNGSKTISVGDEFFGEAEYTFIP